MFDQNWLKRYVVANRATNENSRRVNRPGESERPPVPRGQAQVGALRERPVDREDRLDGSESEASLPRARGLDPQVQRSPSGALTPPRRAPSGSLPRPAVQTQTGNSNNAKMDDAAVPRSFSNAGVAVPASIPVCAAAAAEARHGVQRCNGGLGPSIATAPSPSSNHGFYPPTPKGVVQHDYSGRNHRAAEFSQRSGGEPQTSVSPWSIPAPHPTPLDRGPAVSQWPGAPAPVTPSQLGPAFPTSGPGPLGVIGHLDSSASPFALWNYGNETGMKYFVVMCKDDVEVRASPTYNDDARIGHFLHPGQVVVVDDRRMVNGAWFLHLADGRGWVFETKERLLVMTQAMDFERGLWHYSVVCEDDVETRISPTYSDDARTGELISSGDCIAVDERCTVAGARFLKLADGRGWVFETKDRLLVFSEVRAKPQEARDFERGLKHYTVVCDDDIEIRAAPTYSDEARTGLMLHPGDCVAIDERCRVAAVWFLRLADGRGWVFETKDSRRVMMQVH